MKFSSKAIILLVSVALLLCVAVGSTLSYLVNKSGTLVNTFVPAEVSCAVVENKTEYTDDVVSILSKGNVTIKNTGTIPAYIRAKVVVAWKTADGIVYATKPQATEYTIVFNENDWSEDGGYYYYKSAVPEGESTYPLITSATQNAVGPVGADGKQYALSIEIVAEAIQAAGMGADNAPDAWGNVGK